MQIKKYVSYFLYKTIAVKMPLSNSKFNFGSKAIRYKLAKAMINKCGKNVNIEKGAVFSTRVEIDDFSGIGVNATLTGKTKIGKNVLMGPECIIYSRNHKFNDPNVLIRKQGYLDEDVVVIGDDVWIGGRVTIMPGVKIGNGVVIGAGSIVTKNIPDFAVVGGNPAKVLKFRGDVKEKVQN